MNFLYEKEIGTGSYGIVYAATAEGLNAEAPEERTPVAVKRLVKEKDIMGCSSLCEFDMLSASLGHPFIVQTPMIVDVLVSPEAQESRGSGGQGRGRARVTRVKLSPISKHNFGEDYVENPYHMVFERAEMDMEDFTTKHPDAPLIDRLRLFFELLCGMEWLHARQIIHRDVKPLNMLIFEDPEHPGSTAHMHLKIADFGMVRYHNEAFPSSPNAYTTGFRAPEVVLQCDDYDYAADVWALGAALFYLLTGEHYILPKCDEEDVEMTEEEVAKDILTQILSRNEETLASIDEFYYKYETADQRFMVLNELPYKTEGGKMTRPASRGPLSGAIRVGRDDFTELVRDLYPDDDDELIETAATLLSQCLMLSPGERPSVSEMLDDHMEVFEKVSPGARAQRTQSLECSAQDVPWHSIAPIPAAYRSRFQRVLKFAREIAEASTTIMDYSDGETEEEKQHMLKPNILIHALSAMHRLYLWLDWVREKPEEQTEEDIATAAVVEAEKPEVVYMVAIYMFLKCLMPFRYTSFESFTKFFSDTHPSLADAALTAFVCSVDDVEAGVACDVVPQLALHADGRPCCRAELIERVLLMRIYSFNIISNTLWEEVALALEGEIFSPLQITRIILKHYNELNTEEDLKEFIEQHRPELLDEEDDA